MSEPPKASAAGPELSSNTQGGERADWRRWLLLVGTVVVGVVVATIAVTAWLHLRSTGGETDWIPIYQEVLKTSFAALAVGSLGGLAKLLFDQRKARDAAATELRDRRYRFISTLIEVIYDIETAKLIIRANRSVRSWTDMVNERIVPGCSRLADMAQQLINWADAGLPVFDDTEGVAEELEGMNRYFASLLAEYGNNKQALGELQLKAEAARTTRRGAASHADLARNAGAQGSWGSDQPRPRRHIPRLPQALRGRPTEDAPLAGAENPAQSTVDR